MKFIEPRDLIFNGFKSLDIKVVITQNRLDSAVITNDTTYSLNVGPRTAPCYRYFMTQADRTSIWNNVILWRREKRSC